MLSIATDYAADTGSPQPYLQRIAAAGFSHIHWCHHWNTDFLYSDSEIEQIAKWMDEYGLKLTDLHGSMGPEKNWISTAEYERLAGVELVLNRLRMVARLGGASVVMHLSPPPEEPAAAEAHWAATFRTLDTLAPYAANYGVRLALENYANPRWWEALDRYLATYGPEVVGMCYDSGHGNLLPDGLDRLERVKDRLIALHLHDNDGLSDEHKIPFTGTLDWERFTRILATSSYDRWISMEIGIRRMGMTDEDEFLRAAYAAGSRLTEMVAAARAG